MAASTTVGMEVVNVPPLPLMSDTEDAVLEESSELDDPETLDLGSHGLTKLSRAAPGYDLTTLTLLLDTRVCLAEGDWALLGSLQAALGSWHAGHGPSTGQIIGMRCKCQARPELGYTICKLNVGTKCDATLISVQRIYCP